MLLYACFPQWPLYFRRVNLPKSGTSDNNISGASSSLTNITSSSLTNITQSKTLAEFLKSNTSLLCISYNKTTKSYIESCLGLHKILFSQIPNADFILGAKVNSAGPNLGARSQVECSIQRCLFALVSQDETNKDGPDLLNVVSEIKNLIKTDEHITISHIQQHDHCENMFIKVPVIGQSEEQCLQIANHSQWPVSPIFQWTHCCPVFHSLQRAVQVLHECDHMTEVTELLRIGEQYIPPTFDCAQLQSDITHPFVVVEGLDATGKTTLTETLRDRLQAARYSTPPPCIMHLRKFFDGLPEIIRRAYYSLGNYIVAIEIADVCKTKAVIMDRYWHSTTAYGIANETSHTDVPPAGHSVYQWPADLLKPTSVLFLTVSEQVRQQRLSQRDTQMTREECSLGKDNYFRQRLCEAYRRMENPRCMEIKASGSVQDVMYAAVAILNKHNISLASHC